MLVQVPAPLLLIQFPVSALWEVVEDGLGAWAPASDLGETQMELELLALNWPSSGCCRHLVREPAGSLSVSLSLSLLPTP